MDTITGRTKPKSHCRFIEDLEKSKVDISWKIVPFFFTITTIFTVVIGLSQWFANFQKHLAYSSVEILAAPLFLGALLSSVLSLLCFFQASREWRQQREWFEQGGSKS